MPKRQTHHRAALLVGLAASLVPALAAAAPPPVAAAPSGAPVDLLAPPGRFHHVDGVRIYMHCVGEGVPTVVIDAGIGASSLEWLSVQERLATTTRTCAWDRPGYGWSDPGPSPRTTPQVADELLHLLEAARVDGPWVLVGHSFGGFTARYLAASHPAQVAGLVLVESSTPSTEVDVAAAGTGQQQSNPLIPIDDSATSGVPRTVEAQASYLNTRRKAIFTQMDELRHFHDSSEAVQAAGSLPSIPLLVLKRGERAWPSGPEGDAAEAAWSAAQAHLAALSPLGELRVVPGAGHSPHTEQPDAVAAAIREVVERVRGPVAGGDAPAQHAAQ